MFFEHELLKHKVCWEWYSRVNGWLMGQSLKCVDSIRYVLNNPIFSLIENSQVSPQTTIETFSDWVDKMAAYANLRL